MMISALDHRNSNKMRANKIKKPRRSELPLHSNISFENALYNYHTELKAGCGLDCETLKKIQLEAAILPS